MWDTLTLEQCEELESKGYIILINAGTVVVANEKAPHQLAD